MDYEKAYKEALEKAKQFSENPLLEDSGNIVEYIFPELKESEDERIRKAILELVHDTTGDSLWVDYNVHKENALAWLEKRGQTFTKKDVDDAYLKGISDTKNELEKQGEQKSSWSEEDEKRLRTIISDGIRGAEFDTPQIDWLKSIKPQNKWKPSDEQMVAVQEAMNIVGILTITGSKINSLYQDLKKLRRE